MAGSESTGAVSGLRATSRYASARSRPTRSPTSLVLQRMSPARLPRTPVGVRRHGLSPAEPARIKQAGRAEQATAAAGDAQPGRVHHCRPGEPNRHRIGAGCRTTSLARWRPGSTRVRRRADRARRTQERRRLRCRPIAGPRSRRRLSVVSQRRSLSVSDRTIAPRRRPRLRGSL